MSTPDLPPGLVEAVAKATGCVGISCDCEELDTCDGARRCDTHRAPWPAEEPACDTIRAAVAAMVEHLGLTEETRLRCYCGCGAIHNQPTPRDAWTPDAEAGAVRLVTPWREVQP